MADELIASIRKNGRGDSIRIERGTFKGHDFISLRLWFEEGGQMHPTKKGISFKPDLLPDVIAALQKAGA